MNENKFQAALVKELEHMFPECVVIRNNAAHKQGIPDLLVLYKDKWAMLECKKETNSSHRPNQDYYISKFNNMSYASFIYPENKEEVFDELQQTFRT